MRAGASDSSTSDENLVARARGGEVSAFGALVERYQDRIFNTCYRLCHRHADAEDLTQTVFLKAYEALPRFESRSGFFTWLYRIAVNLVLTQRRRTARHRPLSTDAGDEDRPALRLVDESADGPEVSASDAEQLERLAAALRGLDEEFRVALVLRDIEQMDYAQIAEVLDVPVGTVKSRIHRGRMMLRGALSGAEKEHGRVGA